MFIELRDRKNKESGSEFNKKLSEEIRFFEETEAKQKESFEIRTDNYFNGLDIVRFVRDFANALPHPSSSYEEIIGVQYRATRQLCATLHEHSIRSQHFFSSYNFIPFSYKRADLMPYIWNLVDQLAKKRREEMEKCSSQLLDKMRNIEQEYGTLLALKEQYTEEIKRITYSGAIDTWGMWGDRGESQSSIVADMVLYEDHADNHSILQKFLSRP